MSDKTKLEPSLIEEGKCLDELATKGPWEVIADENIGAAWLNAQSDEDDKAIALFDYRDGAENINNARFAAYARAAIPTFIAEMKSLQTRVKDLLDANNREVERRLETQRELDDLKAQIARMQENNAN